ncbi:MAG: putative Dipeptidyl peptidase 1 [Streblomastix strix]|uniref:Dipeptidyl peptidase 1 n=1 Tax=Streblomastix strix TaxID=222440 RepID=A0A5J4UEF5_9EUKA|nr:MAG: putative Dipeptidyl peptidase 1 [Streblomastix strix]
MINNQRHSQIVGILVILITFVYADQPSSCVADQIYGTWNFTLGKQEADEFINCFERKDPLIFDHNVSLQLIDPNDVLDLNGKHVGKWSMLDDEGFDVYANGIHFSATFNYTLDDKEIITDCTHTFPGWARPDVIHPKNFQCFAAELIKPIQINNNIDKIKHVRPFDETQHNIAHKVKTFNDKDGRVMVTERMSLDQLKRIEISLANEHHWKKPHSTPKPQITNKLRVRNFPQRVDWSEYEGVDYTAPVYDQDKCGSCYAFAAVSLFESRLRIQSKKAINEEISVQDIVSCSFYSQGCGGGFVISVGQWMKDHGIVQNKCFPYGMTDQGLISCKQKCDQQDGVSPIEDDIHILSNQNGTKFPNKDKDEYVVNAIDALDSKFFNHRRREFYAKSTGYVGNYYGNCSEDAMIEALQEGPIHASIYASAPSFKLYTDGIYQPFDNETVPDYTNHGILVVGYGEEEVYDEGIDQNYTQSFWRIKNSWGTFWGDKGYMKVLRGEDIIHIESKASYIQVHYPDILDKERESEKKRAEHLQLVRSTMQIVIDALIGHQEFKETKTAKSQSQQ